MVNIHGYFKTIKYEGRMILTRAFSAIVWNSIFSGQQKALCNSGYTPLEQ